MRTLFILGAGASREAGGPLMSDFLDIAHKLRTNEHTPNPAAFDLVFKSLADLDSIHAKAYLNYDNIEELFGAIEMAQVIQKFANYDPQQIATLRQALIDMIVITLERSITFPAHENHIRPVEPYGEFIHLLKDYVLQRGHHIDFITFNYDLALDQALTHHELPFHYCMGGDSNGIALMKLHGSINWGVCEVCHVVEPYYIREARHSLDHEQKGILDLGSRIGLKRHCDHPLTGPFLVPPSWNKSAYHNEIQLVWRAAAESFAKAENIFIIGYSLPETDQFFRYLYGLGSVSPTRIKGIWVINPCPDVHARVRSMIGRGIEKRLRPYKHTFQETCYGIINFLAGNRIVQGTTLIAIE